MSDINRIRRGPEGPPFPIVRKSTDPLQPESGEVLFSEEMSKYDTESTSTVQGTDKTENSVIREDTRRKRLEKRNAGRHGREPQGEGAGEAAESGPEEKLIDLEV